MGSVAFQREYTAQLGFLQLFTGIKKTERDLPPTHRFLAFELVDSVRGLSLDTGVRTSFEPGLPFGRWAWAHGEAIYGFFSISPPSC